MMKQLLVWFKQTFNWMFVMTLVTLSPPTFASNDSLTKREYRSAGAEDRYLIALNSCIVSYMLSDDARLNVTPSLRPNRQTVWTKVFGGKTSLCLEEHYEFMIDSIESGKSNLARDSLSEDQKKYYENYASGKSAKKTISKWFNMLYNRHYLPEDTAEKKNSRTMEKAFKRMASRGAFFLVFGLIVLGIGIAVRNKK